jgi:hypothetical protein
MLWQKRLRLAVRILNRHRRFTSFNDPGLDTLKIVD